MVGFDIALGFGVEGYPCPNREMPGLALTLRKLPHPATRQWFPASYPARGREPPMLAECLIFTSTERASPGSTNGGLRQKRECRLMACAVKRRRFPVGARPTRRFAPAGSNRSSHGGNEMAEAFDERDAEKWLFLRYPGPAQTGEIGGFDQELRRAPRYDRSQAG